ncbi:MAG: bifunctional oligoribonuclease/PAP phosphatase NrnA [Candidatus Omnitrophica bacterium]|nr:bifunctional oligoribonuclease/PAP phosphatase NrnA [Candidatus Omnitrophota bacterium]
MSIEKTAECVRKNKSFLITSHVNLEADALGSELAFADMLRRLGKRAYILNQDKVPQEYKFLPGTKRIKNKLKDFYFDVGVILDCSDLNRCGAIRKIFTPGIITLNIDHHISNSYFADINWVEPHASSTSEMIYELYKKLHLSFNRNSATALYAGILTDTGSFRYANTNYRTHEAASQLLKYGIKPQQIYRNIYQSNLFEDMQFLAKAFSLAQRDKQGKIVWFIIPQRLVKKSSMDFDLTEHILTFGRQIRGVEVVVLFKESLSAKNQIKVNFRSQGRVDVNKIAKYFGGGGHRTASACTISGNLNVIADKVLAKIKEVLY